MNRGGTRYDWLTRIALDAVWRIDSDKGPGLGWAWEDGRERKQGDQEAGWLVQARVMVAMSSVVTVEMGRSGPILIIL